MVCGNFVPNGVSMFHGISFRGADTLEAATTTRRKFENLPLFLGTTYLDSVLTLYH